MGFKFRQFNLSPALPFQPQSIDEFLGMNNGSIEAVAHVCGCPFDMVAVQSVSTDVYDTVHSIAFMPAAVISARRGAKTYANLPDPAKMQGIEMYAEAASAIRQAAPEMLKQLGGTADTLLSWRNSSGMLEARCHLQRVQVSILTWEKPDGEFASTYAGVERPLESPHSAQIYKALKPVLGLL